MSLASLLDAHRLEAFLGACLLGAGVWDSPRAGDGVVDHRVVDGPGPDLRIAGVIWLVADQSRQTFCLDLDRDPADPARARWTLYYRLLAYHGRSRPRDLRDAWQLLTSPDDATWETLVSGADEVSSNG